jgi:iron complex outermembrane receptor protein
MVYGSYSESFQPQPFGLFTNDLPSGPAKPLIGKGYEAGIKTELLGGRLSGTVGFFDITNTNIIQTIAGAFNPVTGVATSSSIQAGEAKSRGATVELFYSPAKNWQVYATASWDHAYISKNPEDPTLVGTPLQYSTRHLASLWFRHDFSGSWKGLYIAGGPNYTGPKSFLGGGNPVMLKGYTLWNALVAYDGQIGDHKYTVKLNVDNLTDIYYDNSNFDRGLPRRVIGAFTLHY